MTSMLLSRRAFLEGACFTAIASQFSSASSLSHAYGSTRQTTFVRQSIKTFMTDDAKVEALRRGVRRMKEKDDREPTSWGYQARIHGRICQHGNWYFFPWHRAYLYFFEKILRSESGDSTLAVPYWDWSDSTQRSLPIVFRSPSGSSNPLYHRRSMNDGSGLSASAVRTREALAVMDFIGSRPYGFGGPQREQTGGPPYLHGAMEAWAHDDVHVQIENDMGNSPVSAFDPIFWLHHANIDRFWKVWLRMGGRRDHPRDPDNPTQLHPVWKAKPFRFYDLDKGMEVAITPEAVLDTVHNLDYRYDDDPDGPGPAVAVVATKREMADGSKFFLGFDEMRQTPLASSKSGRTKLDALTTTTIESSQEAKAKLSAALTNVQKNGAGAPSLYLAIEGIEYPKSPGVIFEIYLNLPTSEKSPTFESRHYVDNLSFFAHAQHDALGEEKKQSGQGKHDRSEDTAAKRQIFDLAATIKRLPPDTFADNKFTVTFIRRAPSFEKGNQANARNDVGPDISFERASIYLLERPAAHQKSDRD